MSRPDIRLRLPGDDGTLLHGRDVRLRLEEERSPAARAPDLACPHCGEDLWVSGTGRRIGGHSYYAADGVCSGPSGAAGCGRYVGEIRHHVSTIFGIEEDLRVGSMGIKI